MIVKLQQKPNHSLFKRKNVLKNKTKNLQQSLDSNKIFLNMAVHDMRNPTN